MSRPRACACERLDDIGEALEHEHGASSVVDLRERLRLLEGALRLREQLGLHPFRLREELRPDALRLGQQLRLVAFGLGETAQKPLFRLLGTPDADKKWIVYDGGHFVPRDALVKETLAWLDRYLGPVR